MIPVKSPVRGAKNKKAPKAAQPVISLFKDHGFRVREVTHDSGHTQLRMEYGESKPRLEVQLTLYPGNNISLDQLNVDPKLFYTSMIALELDRLALLQEGPVGVFALDQATAMISRSYEVHTQNFKAVGASVAAALTKSEAMKNQMMVSLAKALSAIEHMEA